MEIPDIWRDETIENIYFALWLKYRTILVQSDELTFSFKI